MKNKGLWIVGIILLLAIIVLSYKSCRNDDIIDSYVKPNKIDTTTTKWRDKDNKEHVKVKVNEINYANLIASKDAEIMRLRDEIAADKSIRGKTVIETNTNQVIKVPVKDSIYHTIRDTVKTENKVKILKFKDDWLTLQGELENDTLKMNYGLKNKLSIYEKKEGKKTFLEIVNDNPNTTSNKTVRYDIQQPPVTFFKSKLFYGILGAIAGGLAVHQLSK